MNNNTSTSHDDIKAFQLLSEVADEQPVSQRELARRLGIALGLVNSYIKNFVAKGYIRIKNYPQNRYAYLLTPRGLAEKGRLACQHVHYFTNLYTVTRQEYLQLFRELSARGVRRIAFCGVDEVAEIAWLSLQEAGLELAAVMDDANNGSLFMGHRISPLEQTGSTDGMPIVIASLKRGAALTERLQELGTAESLIIAPPLGRVQTGGDLSKMPMNGPRETFNETAC